MTAPSGVRLASPQGRLLLVMTILGSGMAGIDGTIVNVALPQIGRSFDAPFATLQWVVTGYALTLAAFILLGGVLGDRLGRRPGCVVSHRGSLRPARRRGRARARGTRSARPRRRY